jgi:hypothetical protein
MSNQKICLFTAHSPYMGGGGTILRSFIDNLTEFSISWHYLADNAIIGAEKEYLGRGLMNDGLSLSCLHGLCYQISHVRR